MTRTLRSVALGLLACGAAFSATAGWSVRLADGRQVSIVADGTVGDSAQVLERRNADGSLDRQFGQNGRVVMSLGADSPGPQSIRLDANGRLLVVGAALGLEGHPVPASLRFLPDGRIDASWGIQGRSLIPSPKAHAHAADALALPDGSVLVLGQIDSTTAEQAALWRLAGNGRVDAEFGSAGVMRASGLETSEPLALQLDDDGAALIAVQTLQQGRPWLEVHRWQAGLDQPQRVAYQPMPSNWAGPATLARRGGMWQWFDASQTVTSGGLPLVAVAATSAWSGTVGMPAAANPAVQSAPTEGGAVFNPFSTDARTASSAVSALDPNVVLSWAALVALSFAALLGFGWWRWRKKD